MATQASTDQLHDNGIKVLLKEYELAIDRMEQADNRLIQILGIGFAFFGAVAIFVAQRLNQLGTQNQLGIQRVRPDDVDAVAYLSPLFLIVFYALIIYTLYAYFGHFWMCRVLSYRINRISGKQLLIRFERNLPPSRFFSFAAGVFKPRITYFLVSFLPVSLSCLSLWLLIDTAIHTATWFSWVFVALYLALFLLAGVAASGMRTDMTRSFLDFMNDSSTYDNGLPPVDYSYPALTIGLIVRGQYLLDSWWPLSLFSYCMIAVHNNSCEDFRASYIRNPFQKYSWEEIRFRYFTLISYKEGGITPIAVLRPGMVVAGEYVRPWFWPWSARQIRSMRVLSVSSADVYLSYRWLGDLEHLELKGNGWPTSKVIHYTLSHYEFRQILPTKRTSISTDETGQFQHLVEFPESTTLPYGESLWLLFGMQIDSSPDELIAQLHIQLPDISREPLNNEYPWRQISTVKSKLLLCKTANILKYDAQTLGYLDILPVKNL